MNNQEEPEQIIQRYRTTLINLARHYVAMVEEAGKFRRKAEGETVGGLKSGLFCHSKVRNINAEMLKGILYQDKAMLMFFFGTTNLQTIANQSKQTVNIL